MSDQAEAKIAEFYAENPVGQAIDKIATTLAYNERIHYTVGKDYAAKARNNSAHFNRRALSEAYEADGVAGIERVVGEQVASLDHLKPWDRDSVKSQCLAQLEGLE